MTQHPPKSPLSGRPPELVRDLPEALLRKSLEDYFQEPPPARAVEGDYSLWRCVETHFEFAWPPRAGSEAFYQWIGGFPFYYPGTRWEHREVADRLRAESAGRTDGFKVLDVGCGSGRFLSSLNFLPIKARHAVDFSPLAIRECEAKGLPSHCGSIESALGAGFVAMQSLDAVTSFHCLEHVEQPVEFVEQMLSLLKPGGSLWVSTPNSPMSFESEWFDVLNHPPHHLGRWNPTAYRALARRLGCECDLFSPSASPLRFALGAFKLVSYGPNRGVGRVKRLADLVVGVGRFAGIWRRQRRRVAAAGVLAGDAILVRLTK